MYTFALEMNRFYEVCNHETMEVIWYIGASTLTLDFGIYLHVSTTFFKQRRALYGLVSHQEKALQPSK